MKMKNSILKKMLIVIIVIVMTSNFIMPNAAYAISAKEAGEKIVSGVFYLIAYLGDAGISIMQRLMIGTGDIKSFGDYSIKYSPGIIFSNAVPALDINFITATEKDNVHYDLITEDINSKDEMLTLVKESGITKDNFTQKDTTRKNYFNQNGNTTGMECKIQTIWFITILCRWLYGNLSQYK